MRGIFDGLYGNEAAKERFSSAVLAGTLPHAFLIDGPEGSGKTTLALEISAALNCEHKGDRSFPLPCRRCNTCRRIFEGSYTDIKTLRKQDSKSSIGVDAVKDFKEDMFLSATESDYKIYIIDDAETLTPQSQNALLTVMEEPPPSVVIFLLSSSSDRILTTIKSRAQYTAMERFSREALEKYLTENVSGAASLRHSRPESFSAVLMKADGCIGQAISLLDPEGALKTAEERQSVLRVVKALDTRATYRELHSALLALPERRSELTSALEEILAAIGDLIKAKNAPERSHPVFYDTEEEALSASRTFSQKRLFEIYGHIRDAHDRITKNAMAATVLASMAANIKLI